MFSARSYAERELNPLTAALQARRESSSKILDLSISNPTRAGLSYPEAAIREALLRPEMLNYAPDPFGLLSARRSLSEHLLKEGVNIAPEHLMLTSGTSQAYSHLFTLLCDPGDEILVPQPSYPLLAQLAYLHGVQLRTYPLRFDGRWSFDPSQLWESINDRTRAIVVVSPNNPTGSMLTVDEGQALGALGLPLIVDEVFAPYRLSPPKSPVRAGALKETLTFGLDGLSKRAALPQLKLAWTSISGPDAQVEEARERLSLIADAYLCPNTLSQLAVADLLKATEALRQEITARAERNFATMHQLSQNSPLTLPPVEGGWYASLRLPHTQSDEAWALALLEEGVYAQPGYFYDFPDDESWLVLSLLTPEPTFEEGMARIAAFVQAQC